MNPITLFPRDPTGALLLIGFIVLARHAVANEPNTSVQLVGAFGFEALSLTSEFTGKSATSDSRKIRGQITRQRAEALAATQRAKHSKGDTGTKPAQKNSLHISPEGLLRGLELVKGSAEEAKETLERVLQIARRYEAVATPTAYDDIALRKPVLLNRISEHRAAKLQAGRHFGDAEFQLLNEEQFLDYCFGERMWPDLMAAENKAAMELRRIWEVLAITDRAFTLEEIFQLAQDVLGPLQYFEEAAFLERGLEWVSRKQFRVFKVGPRWKYWTEDDLKDWHGLGHDASPELTLRRLKLLQRFYQWNPKEKVTKGKGSVLNAIRRLSKASNTRSGASPDPRIEHAVATGLGIPLSMLTIGRLMPFEYVPSLIRGRKPQNNFRASPPIGNRTSA
jgi:hypothetical protein